jgi:hypothetical protein
MIEDEDITFRPDEAEIRSDERECPFCHYLHYFWIKCPECFPLTKTEYERLTNGTQFSA